MDGEGDGMFFKEGKNGNKEIGIDVIECIQRILNDILNIFNFYIWGIVYLFIYFIQIYLLNIMFQVNFLEIGNIAICIQFLEFKFQ